MNQPNKNKPNYGILADLINLEKISAKQGVDLYGRSKIESFITGLSIFGEILDFSPVI